MNTKTTLSKGSWKQLNERRAAQTGMLLLLLLLTLPAAVQAQFNYTTNSGGITITGYTGPGGDVTIPDTINGLPVTGIADGAFESRWTVRSLTNPNSVTRIGAFAFYMCTNLVSFTVPDSLTSIGGWAFTACKLSHFTIPRGVNSIAAGAFNDCESLTAITVDTNNSFYSSVDGVLFGQGQTTLVQCPGAKEGAYTIPNGVTSIGPMGFFWCKRLTSVTIPSGANYIGENAFVHCISQASVTIPSSVTNLAGWAFCECVSLTGAYFKGNAPSLSGPAVFSGDTNATVYYLPGTTGWDPTFGDRPTAVWILEAPTILIPPRTQTSEMGSAAYFAVRAAGSPLLTYQWYFNDNTPIGSLTTNAILKLPSVQSTQAGAYAVVVANDGGAVTSSPALLNVIAAVERRPVPGVKVMGEAGSLLNVDYANTVSPAPNWTTLLSFSMTSTSQCYFELADPLPPQWFFRVWQAGTPGVRPSLDLHLVPAITLSGNIGASVRLDYINRFGPTGAWLTLDTVTLTNTSQLYFDVAAPGQPQRCYRLVPLP